MRSLILAVATACLLHGLGARWTLLAAPPADPPDAPAQTPKPVNRLAKETSPYLLLHAHNPVDWFAWGDEALSKAKVENKLIFLSIGYSSCYWCHVMERESFMDDEIAAFMNKHFVCIKVDREERPDIDDIYMTALQVTGQRGGWPLSMFLTPDARPLGGGTYFPPREKDIERPAGTDGQPAGKQKVTGFLQVLEQVEAAWRESPDKLQASADQITDAVRRTLRQRPLAAAAPPDESWTKGLLAALEEQFDREYGGFGASADAPRQPKFPEPSNLTFLLDRWRRTGDKQARTMLTLTLRKMAEGGIRDHVGGGFHRYSTDRFWLVPHFEKMLYDNAQLVSLYASAYDLDQRDEYKSVIDETLAFVLRELSDENGGFFTALDAETDGEEGRYYVWTRAEIEQALTGNEYDLMARAYGIGGEANFEDRYVLHLPRSLKAVAAEQRLKPQRLARSLRPILDKLLAVRNRRKRPLTDTKILADSNGLMIKGFADAGRLLKNRAYVASAAKAANYVLLHLRDSDGRLMHAYTGGKAHLNAYLDDYAFLIEGLLALHRATGEKRWLEEADLLCAAQLRLFWDDEGGGCFFTSHDHEELIARIKDPIDSVVPSGNAVTVDNLVYLARELDKREYLDRARRTVLAFAGWIWQAPSSLPRLASAWTAVRTEVDGRTEGGGRRTEDENEDGDE